MKLTFKDLRDFDKSLANSRVIFSELEAEALKFGFITYLHFYASDFQYMVGIGFENDKSVLLYITDVSAAEAIMSFGFKYDLIKAIDGTKYLKNMFHFLVLRFLNYHADDELLDKICTYMFKTHPDELVDADLNAIIEWAHKEQMNELLMQIIHWYHENMKEKISYRL